MSTNETIILAVEQHDHDITIRIDKNGLAQSHFVGLPVVELQLLGVSDPDSVMDELAVDLSLDYEIKERPGETSALMCVNYSPDDFEVKCSSVREIDRIIRLRSCSLKPAGLPNDFCRPIPRIDSMSICIPC